MRAFQDDGLGVRDLIFFFSHFAAGDWKKNVELHFFSLYIFFQSGCSQAAGLKKKYKGWKNMESHIFSAPIFFFSRGWKKICERLKKNIGVEKKIGVGTLPSFAGPALTGSGPAL